jgi:hypothetical protein
VARRAAAHHAGPSPAGAVAAAMVIGLGTADCPARVGAPSVPIRSVPRSLLQPMSEVAPLAARAAAVPRGRSMDTVRGNSGLRGVARSDRPGLRLLVAALDDSIRWHGITAIEVGARVPMPGYWSGDPMPRDAASVSPPGSFACEAATQRGRAVHSRLPHGLPRRHAGRSAAGWVAASGRSTEGGHRAAGCRVRLGPIAGGRDPGTGRPTWRGDTVGRAINATIAAAQRDGDARAWLAAGS